MLKSRSIKVVGIIATDPLDEAFLIRWLKKSTPDTRIFLRDPDLLFLRTPDVGSLNGMLLVSNYPLIPQNQFWQGDWAARKPVHVVSFPTATQEAEFNALTLFLAPKPAQDSLVRNPLGLLEPDYPWKTGPQAATANKSSVGPLWLTTSGTTGFFPLTIIDRDSIDKLESTDKQVKHPEMLTSLPIGKPPYFGLLLWLFSVALGCCHVIGLYRGRLPLFKDDFDLREKTNVVAAAKAFCHTTMLLCLAFIQLVLGSSYVFFSKTDYSVAPLRWAAKLVKGEPVSLYSLLKIVVILATLTLTYAAGRVFWNSILRPLHWQRAHGGKLLNSEHLNIQSISRKGFISILLLLGPMVCWTVAVFPANFSNAFMHFRDL